MGRPLENMTLAIRANIRPYYGNGKTFEGKMTILPATEFVGNWPKFDPSRLKDRILIFHLADRLHVCNKVFEGYYDFRKDQVCLEWSDKGHRY